MSDERSLLAALAARHRLSDEQQDKLMAIIARLARDEHAPTAVREPAAALAVHVADSLVALERGALSEARSIADLGSGAGFPGLAIAVARPDAEVRLVESQRRKCEFLTQLIAEVQIANASVVCGRAESWREGAGRHDAVLARALAAQPVVLEYAAPLLRLGGTLIDWRGRRAPEEERAALKAAEVLGMQELELRSVEPYDEATDRHLHLFRKVAETPQRFPRRPGIARKRPLA